MKSVRLAIRFDDDLLHPIHALVCESDAVDRELILEGQVTDGVETVLSYVEGDADPYESRLRSIPRVLEYDITPDAAADGFFVYARQELGESGASLVEAFAQETVVLVPPIEFRADRTMRLTLIGHADDLQAVVDGFPPEATVDVRWIGDHARAAGDRLTDRQREALSAAWEVGYYDVPRDGDLEAVADALDCATATASTLLRRGERRLVAAALGNPAE